jgi:UDP-glucose 4-epimerase
VLDVVRALVDLMTCPTAPGKVYNLGSDREISLIDLADMVVGLTRSKSKKVFLSYEQAYGRPFDDMLRRVPSLKRIHQIIGFEPKYSLEETLGLVIKEIQGRLENPH